jgi:radical SAM superfamily enzyme YgiQ (UPF0313 family)
MAQCAACLRQEGFSVDVVDVWVEAIRRRKLIQRISSLKPGIVIAHVDSLNREVVVDLIGHLRETLQQQTKFVAFGQYAEIFPGQLLGPTGPFDSCVFGEPELTLVELCRNFSEGKDAQGVAGTAYSDPTTARLIRNEERDLIPDLDTLPHPAYDIFDLDLYAKQSSFVPIAGPVRWGWMLSSRGCPFNCEFCSPTLRKSCGRHYRSHSPSYVADVIEDLITRFGCNALAFEDDVFSLSRSRTMEIANELITRKLQIFWTAQTHLSTLDEELITRMKQSGCRGLCMGIEAGNDEVRKRIKSNSLSREMMIRNVALLHKHEIATTLYFMIGSPGETLEQMEETLQLALELKPMMIQLAFYTPYPGSRAWEQYVKETGSQPELSHYNRFTVNLSGAKREDVLAFYQKFYRSFYLSPDYILRFLRHRLPYTIRQTGSKEWLLMLRSLAFMSIPTHGIKLPWRKG